MTTATHTAFGSAADLPDAIFLMGPTASGKSSVAIELAGRLPVEIVSVDSAQVYRGMNIGTAKPDISTRLRYPHHLVDVIDPTESYSAARFRDEAMSVMEDIVERGRIPLLVGGTMLYFKALREGLSDLPAADKATRQVIETMAREAGWPALHAELERIDPQTAARIDANDVQRIQRALEIHYVTGKTMSELIAQGARQTLPYRLHEVALLPSERSVLHARIESRFEDMLELGLIGELRELRRDYELSEDMPSMRCVGYRQVWQYLDGTYGLATLREKAVAATRQLAKRQLTWLRAMDGLLEFDCLDEDFPGRVAECLEARVAQRN